MNADAVIPASQRQTFQATLTALQDDVPPLAFEEISEVIHRELGAIFRFVYASLYCHGLFNADPHPGNYIFHPDGTVTFLDFGCVQRFAAERVSDMSALLDATLARSPTGVASALIRLGLLAGNDDTALDQQHAAERNRSPTCGPAQNSTPEIRPRRAAVSVLRAGGRGIRRGVRRSRWLVLGAT